METMPCCEGWCRDYYKDLCLSELICSPNSGRTLEGCRCVVLASYLRDSSAGFMWVPPTRIEVVTLWDPHLARPFMETTMSYGVFGGGSSVFL